MTIRPTVFVIEPDAPVRESISAVANALELHCEAFTQGQDFLDAFDRNRPGCLVLEVRIPGVNGLQIQQTLIGMHAILPMIFLTGSASVSIAVHAMRAGALHFLEKPFHEHDLWSAIQEAVHLDQKRREANSHQEQIDTRLGLLSERELVVLELLADCKSKHAMAEDLGVSVRTIEHHRTQLMRKLKTNSISGLLHFALAAKGTRVRPQGNGLATKHLGNGFALHSQELTVGNGSHNGLSNGSLPEVSVRRRNTK